MKTQKFMGRDQLVNRLSAQVGSRALAVNLLIDRGDMRKDGKTLTAQGKKRNAMTAEERAKDRAAKRSGKPASAYRYNRSTNSATLKD